MAIEGFDYKTFAEELASQAGDLLPKDFPDFQKTYVINTIKNFATLSGEAVYNDEKANFTADQAMLITQIIAEWSFHKSVDVIKAGILPDYWDGIMQKIAFTIFEIAKQTISKGLPQDEILQIVEHHVKKSYETVLQELKERKVIDDAVLDRAIHQSNIDDMMEIMHQERVDQQMAADVENASVVASSAASAGGGASAQTSSTNSKILKLASVALLLKQVSQDKVQSILNKFDENDAQTVIQYIKMPDLEQKVDQGIAMKCLQEIKTHLPEPKFINPEKILSKMNEIFEKLSKADLDRITVKERPKVKEFITMARDGEYSKMPSKVANIIAQHLEESVS